jgi:hypothetical protein
MQFKINMLHVDLDDKYALRIKEEARRFTP